MAEHNTLTGSSLHEPKGVASANLDEMYHADGAGSGIWKKVDAETHGEMLVTGYTTAFAVPLAADGTLATDSDYVKITASSMWQTGHLDGGVTFNVDELVVPTTGTYSVSFWASIDVAVTNALVGIKYAINDSTPYSTRKILTKSKTTSDIANIGGIGLVNLTAGDTISLYIASDTATNVIGKEAGLTVVLL